MKNGIGQDIKPYEIVTHTTASQYAHMSVGFVREIVDLGRAWHGRQTYQAKVTWVYMNGNVLRHPVKTAVMLDTVTAIDPHTISPEILDAVSGAVLEHAKAVA